MTHKHPSAAEVLRDLREEVDQLRKEWVAACESTGLSSIEARLTLLEAEVALHRHRHAEHFALDQEDDETDTEWSRAHNMMFAMADNEREALAYALEKLLDDTPYDAQVEEWEEGL